VSSAQWSCPLHSRTSCFRSASLRGRRWSQLRQARPVSQVRRYVVGSTSGECCISAASAEVMLEALSVTVDLMNLNNAKGAGWFVLEVDGSVCSCFANVMLYGVYWNRGSVVNMLLISVCLHEVQHIGLKYIFIILLRVCNCLCHWRGLY